MCEKCENRVDFGLAPTVEDVNKMREKLRAAFDGQPWEVSFVAVMEELKSHVEAESDQRVESVDGGKKQPFRSAQMQIALSGNVGCVVSFMQLVKTEIGFMSVADAERMAMEQANQATSN